MVCKFDLIPKKRRLYINKDMQSIHSLDEIDGEE